MEYLFGLFFLIPLIFMGGIGYIIYWVIKRRQSTTVADTLDYAMQKADAKKDKLIPWTDESYSDLSLFGVSGYMKGASMEKKSGTIWNFENKPIMSWGYGDRGSFVTQAQLVANTSTHNYYLSFEGIKGIKFHKNGSLFGAYAPNRGMINTQRQIIGTFDLKRVIGANLDNNYNFDFVFESGLKGCIANPSNSQEQELITIQMGGFRAIQIQQGTPTEEEKDFLICMTLVFYCSDYYAI